MDYARQRLAVAFVISVFATTAIITGLTFDGAFSAKIAARHSPVGPLKFGVDGQVGNVEGDGLSGIKTSTPFDGPTAEERELLLNSRRVFAAHWNREQRALKHIDPSHVPVAPPEMFLPTRHLTQYEKDQITRATKVWDKTQ
jgi:hypothetical protein